MHVFPLEISIRSKSNLAWKVKDMAHDRKNSFGSPSEPHFNEHDKISLDLLQQYLCSLSRENGEAITRCDIYDNQCYFKNGNASVYVFELCHHFKLPEDVQYKAVEIFHRFMSKHVVELYQHVLSTRNTASPIDWQTVEGRLIHQVSLRALTSVQLASKLCLHYKIIGISKAQKFLRDSGFRYNSHSLVQSEIRVLRTLGFKVHWATPLSYIETLLEILATNDTLPVKQIHEISLKLLDLFYLCSHSILQRLAMEGGATNVQEDYMFLACAVIGASSFVLDCSDCDAIVHSLSEIACITYDDIYDYSAIIVEYIMTDDR